MWVISARLSKCAHPGAGANRSHVGGIGYTGAMVIVLVYGVALLLAVLVSGFAARTVLSTSLLFLVVGAALGGDGFGVITLKPGDPIVESLADLALFTTLFADGQRASLSEVRATSRLSGRALVLGLPMALGLVAVATKLLTGLDWVSSFLVGAILSPTDPVFAAAIVGRTDVPLRLRRLLNVESGLNDGLALPIVIVLTAVAAHGGVDVVTVVAELALGVVLGFAFPLVAGGLARLPGLGSEARLQPLGPFAIGVALYATCKLTEANPYLAAFTAGSTIASLTPAASHAFEEFGDLLAELLKLAALLVFGSLLTPALFGRLPIGGYVVAVLSLLVVRPLSLLLSLIRARINRREKLAAAWFGPKGFASVVYGLYVLESGIPTGQPVFDIVAVSIAVSILAHSSTDVPVARMFGTASEAAAEVAAETAARRAGEPRPLPALDECRHDDPIDPGDRPVGDPD